MPFVRDLQCVLRMLLSFRLSFFPSSPTPFTTRSMPHPVSVYPHPPLSSSLPPSKQPAAIRYMNSRFYVTSPRAGVLPPFLSVLPTTRYHTIAPSHPVSVSPTHSISHHLSESFRNVFGMFSECGRNVFGMCSECVRRCWDILNNTCTGHGMWCRRFSLVCHRETRRARSKYKSEQ